MNIKLTGAPPTEVEMQAPAAIKPEDASPNVPKQAAPAHATKPASKAEKKPDEKKPAKKKKTPAEDDMQLSLEGWF